MGSIDGKQVDICKGNIILSHEDCFCLQEKKGKMKPEVFCVPNTSATASAKMKLSGIKSTQPLT